MPCKVEASSAAETPLPLTSARTTASPSALFTASKKSPPISLQERFRMIRRPPRSERRVGKECRSRWSPYHFAEVLAGLRSFTDEEIRAGLSETVQAPLPPVLMEPGVLEIAVELVTWLWT